MQRTIMCDTVTAFAQEAYHLFQKQHWLPM